MNINDCMKRNVISISEKATVREAASIITEKHIGLLPVVSGSGKLLGIASRVDIGTSILASWEQME